MLERRSIAACNAPHVGSKRIQFLREVFRRISLLSCFHIVDQVGPVESKSNIGDPIRSRAGRGVCGSARRKARGLTGSACAPMSARHGACQQVLAARLCAYVDPERQNRDLLPLVDRQCDHAALPDGGKQVVQDLAVQGIQDIVVLETELLKPLRHAVPEKGADHAQRCSFLKKSRRGVPGSEVCTVLTAPVDGLASFFPQLNKA